MSNEDYPSKINVASKRDSTLDFTFNFPTERVYKGTFVNFDVCILLLGTNPLNAVFKINIDAGSLKAATVQIEKQLKGHTCLDVKKYDTITFISSKLEKSGTNKYLLKGLFTMCGISRPIQFELTHHGDTDADDNLFCSRLTFNGVINRCNFGMPDGLSNPGTAAKIHLHASIEFEPWDGRDFSVFDILQAKNNEV